MHYGTTALVGPHLLPNASEDPTIRFCPTLWQPRRSTLDASFPWRLAGSAVRCKPTQQTRRLTSEGGSVRRSLIFVCGHHQLSTRGPCECAFSLLHSATLCTSELRCGDEQL